MYVLHYNYKRYNVSLIATFSLFASESKHDVLIKEHNCGED